MGKLKRILMTTLIGIGAIFIISAPVNAANKPQLQTEIEATINTALNEYLSTVDVKAAVNEVIDKTLSSFIDDMTKETFEDEIKQEASNALMQHINSVQSTLDSAITSSTYEYTNNQVKQYLKNYIVNNVNGKITIYNNKMKSKYRTYHHDYDEDGYDNGYWTYDRTYVNGKSIYTYELYIITDREREVVLSTIGNKLDSILSFGYDISNSVLSNADAVRFSQVATDYISDNIIKCTDAQAILNKVRNDVKITVSDELRDKIAESIQTYIESNSGQAIFTGIKDAIYYYIQQNGGLDKILKEGFGDETAQYVSSQIGNIVKESIQYSLAPYIKELSQGRLKEVTESITQEYVNGGAWQVIVNAINYNFDQLLATDNDDRYDLGGDKIRNNLVNLVDAYLARSTRIIDIINESLKSTSVEYHVNDYWVTEDDGEDERTYRNPKYDNISTVGQLVLEETRSVSRTYMANTIFPQVKSFAKTTVNNYMNGEGGAIIKQQFVDNVNSVFTTELVQPLLDEINRAVANWISNGIGEKITADLQVTIKNYLANIKDPDEFSQETGIKLGEILKEVRYNTSSSSGRTISLEELVSSKTLVGAQRGKIIVPKESSTSPLDDATVELGALLPYKVPVYELSAGNMVIVNPYWTAITAVFRFFPNPYGATIGQSFIGVGVGPAGLSRTLAKYDTAGIKNLEPEEAYVLAHQKNTQYYPDKVQSAYYQVLKEVRGINPEYDEGIVDKDTYQTFLKVFGFTSILANTNWSNVWKNLSNANSVSDVIRAIPTSLISATLAAAGISLYDLIPFIDPEILMIASMFGINIGNLASILQTSLASVVGWVETGGNSFFSDMQGLKNSAIGVWDRTTGVFKNAWNMITGIKDDILDATQPLDEKATILELEMDSKTSEINELTDKIEDIDRQMETATGPTLESLQASKNELTTQLNNATKELNGLTAEAVNLAGKYPESVSGVKSNVQTKLEEALGESYRGEAAQISQEVSAQLKFLEEIGALEGEKQDLAELAKELGVNPSNGPLSAEDIANINVNKIQGETTPIAAGQQATTSANAASELLSDINSKVNSAADQFDISNAINNEKFQVLAQDSKLLSEFVQVTNNLGVSMNGKNLSTVFSEIMTEWEKQPDFDPVKAPVFLGAVAHEYGVKMTSQKTSTILNNVGMSWQEFKNKMSNMTFTDGISSLLNNRYLNSSSFLYALQMLMPFPSELADDYEMEDPLASYELAEEAINLGKALDKWNDFEAKNGANLVDRTDYSKVKVSYSKNTDYILAGPFTIDYIREFYYPVSEYDSEMVDLETGIISYTGIVGAELYADDEKTIKVEDWEFVYPDKRDCLPYEDSAYEYPYPGETFYLKFPSTENYSINTLSKLTFKLAKMDADGQTYELHGGYDQLLWLTSGIPIPCPLVGRCICGVPGGHPLGPYLWCPPVFCPIHGSLSSSLASQTTSQMNQVLGSGAASSAASTIIAGVQAAAAADAVSLPPAFPGVHMIGNFYFCFRVTLGSDLHAQNLEEIIYSKIYVEYQTVELELGEVQEYHNNDVNTTNILFPAQHQGNLSIETNEVPQLPFLPNYEGYPGWPNYPYYDNNPNYPDNPYYPDNEAYKDYPSWPYYTGDPTYPYYPNNRVIPLTFHIEGNVWLDNPGGTEAEINGIMDSNERGIPNVEVVLYKVDDPDNYIAKTLTDENGKYMFEYIRVGFDYYVEFLYDGMTYKSTKYLGSDKTEYANDYLSDFNASYKENPEAFLDYSHAIEDMSERDEFNAKFFEISENLATAEDGTTIPLEYQTWYTDNGAVSTLITTDTRGITLDEFKMASRTMTTELYFPLDDQYQVDYDDLDLFWDNSDVYIHTYPGLEHINLGLVQREQGDMTVKTDLYQIITTIKEDVQRYPYDGKVTADDTYDILYRENGYYTDIPYNQEINPDDHTYRVDTTYGDYADVVGDILTEEDELNVYLEFKLLIKNNATLHSGRVIVLENSFDQDLGYATSYDYTDMTSWIETKMNGSEEVEREPIIWHYRAGTENGYSTIYTTDLKDKNIAPGEVVELHLVLKVNKDVNGGVILDPDDNNNNDVKQSITEIHTYSYDEGLIDKSSNPGSIKLGNTRTYPDSADPAPLIKVVLDRDYTTGNEITGYVWEDLINGILTNNNQFIGNGLRENSEPLIDNVKVELIEVVTDKQTGREVEVVRKTASGTDYYRTGQDITVDGKTLDIQKGQYRFTKLETGIFKVKFTYGDDYQLSRDLTYNGQDYKTLALDTIIQQYYNKNLEVMILNDTSEGMDKNNTTESTSGLKKSERMRNAVQEMIEKLYEKVQTVKVGGISFSEPKGNNSLAIGLTQKPNKELVKQIFKQNVTNVGGTLSDAIKQAQSTFTSNADAKVIVILTDGYMENVDADKQALIDAQRAGIKVVTIACSTDEWDKATFGTEDEPTAGNLYNIKELNISQYVTEVALEDILLEFEKVLPNLTDAKDVEDGYITPAGSKVGDIFSRKRSIDYSSTMTNENAEVLDLDNIKALQAQLADVGKDDKLAAEINNRIKKLADNTKVTAITTPRNIVLSHRAERTQEVNLGLVERPKLEVKLQEKVSRIVVTLSNGEVIIDTARDLTQNVQLIPNSLYSIYMDKEIMQGAKIDVDYILTITNNGQVDTLADYYTYDMFNPTEVAYMTRTVPIKIGTLNNYYSNLTFRAEDNTNLEVETNSVTLGGLRFNGTVLQNASSLINQGKTATPNVSKIETNREQDERAIVLQETVTWDNKHMIGLNDSVNDKIDADKVKVVETTSLRNTELFPNMSKETLSDIGESSINIYVKYSKNISANDSEDVLTYKNSTEIVERLSDVGRRDYIALPGNYLPHDKDITEYDAAVAERITILPPFGENHSNYYVIAIVSVVILGVGIVFIRKKVL